MLPAALVRELTARFGAPTDIRPVTGGCINDAASFSAGGRRLFVKWNDGRADDLAGMFGAEADGLRRLRGATWLAVPEPLAWEDRRGDAPAWLVMSDFGSGEAAANFAERLGTGVAALHRVVSARHGLERDNFIGSLPQPNRSSAGWVEFFGTRRIGVQAELAARSGSLPTRTLDRLDRVLTRLPDLIPDDVPASLMHGDLWSGNFGVGTDGAPVIFDPAVYFGHREVELAFTELFGGFPRGFYDAYEATWPLDPGYSERRDLYNLYPLMVHANLFGGGYGVHVAAVARQFA